MSGTALIRSLATASNRHDILSVSATASAAVLVRWEGRMIVEAFAAMTVLPKQPSETETYSDNVNLPQVPAGAVDRLTRSWAVLIAWSRLLPMVTVRGFEAVMGCWTPFTNVVTKPRISSTDT